MSQLAMRGPLDEGDLYNNFRLYPMRPKARQSFSFCEGRFLHFELIQPRPKLEQQLRIKAGADFSSEDEIFLIIVPDKQCAETYTAALWICESTNDEFLRRFAFHFQPVR